MLRSGKTGRRPQWLSCMKAKSGIKLLDELEGSGEAAKKGDKVVYNVRIHLNKGEEVPLNERQAENLPVNMLRTEKGRRLVDHEVILGKEEQSPESNMR